MSQTVHIESPQQFSSLLQSSTLVVADFYADWCGPCKAIAPLYEQLSSKLSRQGRITFTKINTDQQAQIAQSYNITAMPTFLVFKNGREINRIRGADQAKLSEAIRKLAAEAESMGDAAANGGASGSAGGDGTWRGAELPRGYQDITDEVDVKGLDLLNADAEFGSVRTLFESSRPSAAGGGGAAEGKGKGKAADGAKDWVESDTDEQLMLYVPFQSVVKVHTIHITSHPPTDNDDDDETPMRPKTIQLYVNSAHNMGFDEAEDITPTQSVELKASDWNPETGTAKVELRFVKFQKVTSLVMFVKDGEGSSEKTRIDRVRFIGESGDKRDPGKLEKVGDDH